MERISYVYIYKEDLESNNLQGLICQKIQPAKQPNNSKFSGRSQGRPEGFLFNSYYTEA